MIIAVAGGICSGKSEVMAQLRAMGANIVKTDDINRQMLQDKAYIAKIAESFPSVVENGVVNKAKLREIIVSDDVARARLNSIAHPEIFKKVEQIAKRVGGTIFVEVPLLIGTDSASYFDEIWSVYTPTEERIKRLVVRDGITEQQAEAIIKIQEEENKTHKIAQCVIDNSGNKDDLHKKVKIIYEKRVAR